MSWHPWCFRKVRISSIDRCGPKRDRVLRPGASLAFTIGIISDTHSLLRPEALRVLGLTTFDAMAAGDGP